MIRMDHEKMKEYLIPYNKLNNKEREVYEKKYYKYFTERNKKQKSYEAQYYISFMKQNKIPKDKGNQFEEYLLTLQKFRAKDPLHGSIVDELLRSCQYLNSYKYIEIERNILHHFETYPKEIIDILIKKNIPEDVIKFVILPYISYY